MPEGDVLRLTAARLDEALSGRELVRAELRWPGAAGAHLEGRVVTVTAAYGKHLLTRLDHGWTLHTHLRMDGTWRLSRTGSPAARGAGHTVRAVLANRWWTAVGVRLGMLDLLRTHDERLVIGALGPDVLADDFPATGLGLAVDRLLAADARGGYRGDRAAAVGVPVCEALLDQHGVAGLGTVWVAESLWARRVWPWTPVRELGDLAGVLTAARTLMLRSVAAGLDDRLKNVHGRAGRACRRCGTPVAVGTANDAPFDRPIFYCPRCQAPER